MATYVGYVNVPHDTYTIWKNNTLGNFFDADGLYGCQCYDLVLIFWYSVGFPQGYPVSSNLGAAGIWDRRNENLAWNGTTYFSLVYNLDEVKTGDILIYSGFPGNEFGHVGFADQDYATWHAANPGSYEFPILSENNGGTPYPSGGTSVNVHGYDTRLFRGAFRYIPWIPTPPTPTPTQETKEGFPWPIAWRHWKGFKRDANLLR